MEFSPYLQAIQTIAGENAGKKYKTLNCLARKIIADTKDLNSIEVRPSESLPDPLIPLVKLEIARVLKQPEEVVDALKSEDQFVFERALRVKWFFDGSIENYPNAHYFQENIWPCISFSHRKKIIKALGNNLAFKESKIAEEFYLQLCETYCHFQAYPLLKACSESFIWDSIIKHQLIIEKKDIKFFFLKYPKLILKYLKLGISDNDPYKRNLHVIPLYTYKHFFPLLLKKYSRNLVELIVSEKGTFQILLNPRHTELFLKNEVDELIKDPQLFLPMLSLKTVTKKLSRAQFEVIFEKLFPQKISEFNFVKYFRYLEFIPENEKMTLLLDTFKKVYNKNLLECHNLIDSEMLLNLPQEDRVTLARCKLETSKDWLPDYVRFSWRCYLPIEESIPMIIDEISKRKRVEERADLIEQLFFTCEVNHDNDALLEVLKYITTRHKNEKSQSLNEMIATALRDFDLEHLTVDHWQLIVYFIKRLYVTNQLKYNMGKYLQVLEAGIHFDLLNDQSITEKLILYTKVNMLKYSYKLYWNIIQKTPNYERKCLEEFAKIIPKTYLKIAEESEPWLRVVGSFTEAIYDFNTRNNNTDKLPKLSIKNYSWLLNSIKELVNDKLETYVAKTCRHILKIHERDLYNLWVSDETKLLEISLQEALGFLKNDPKKILDQCIIYYELLCSQTHRKDVQKFFKNSRWSQDIPMKFVENGVCDIRENKSHQAFLVLALLLEGPAFEKLIAPYAPKNAVVNIEGDNPKEDFMFAFSISRSLNLVNPPVSLDYVLSFCEGDHIHTILNCLTNMKQVAVDKLILFCQKLISRRVSVKKHGIRLLRVVASTSQLLNTLMNLWKEEKHKSIRLIIVETLFVIVTKKPSSESILMMNECLDDLTVDDRDILPVIKSIDKIPNEYVVEYYKKLLVGIRKLANHEDVVGTEGMWFHLENLLQNVPINVAVLFPEELHEEILRNYLIDFSLPKNIILAGIHYLIGKYIKPARDKLESRLKVFSSMFEKIINDHLNTPNDDGNYLGNYFFFNLSDIIMNNLTNSPDEKKFLQTVLHVFRSTSKPQLAPNFYCKTTLMTLYNDETPPKEFAAKIVQLLPSLVDIFSVAFIPTIASFLYELIQTCSNFTDDAILDMIEFLLQLNDEHAIFLGASLLQCDNKSRSERFWNLIKVLQQHKHPLVIASVQISISKHRL